MSTIMKLVQGSPEWLAHRLKYRNRPGGAKGKAAAKDK